MSTIVIPHEIVQQVREESSTSLESAGIYSATKLELVKRARLLAIAYAAYDEADYILRSEHAITISPEAVNRYLQLAASKGLSYIQVQLAPRIGLSRLSACDDAGEREMLPTIFRRLPNGVHGSLVVGSTAWAARVYSTPTEWLSARILKSAMIFGVLIVLMAN